MKESTALVPVDQRTVAFYEDEVTAVLVQSAKESRIYVPVRPICDYLGVDWSAQRQRINRDPVLSTVIQGVVITTTPSPKGRGGGPQEMLCLPLDYLNGWLFGINADRVKPNLRDQVIRYQRECYRVLAEAFQEGRLSTDPAFDELLQSDSDTVQAYKMALAVVKLARNQIMLEARLGNVEQRLEQVEASFGDPNRYVTQEQASQISQAVKAIALKLGQKTGRNEYGGVYGELYRRFGITGYKLLPARRFPEAMRWLTDWYENLTGDAKIPF